MDTIFFFSNVLPVVTTISIAVVGYILLGLNNRIDRVELRQDRFEARFETEIGNIHKDIGNIHKEIGELKGQIGELKGLITGYFSRPEVKN